MSLVKLISKHIIALKFEIHLHFNYVVTEVSFNQSVYSADENDEMSHLLLTLSNPSSTDFSVEVFNTNMTALGKPFSR